MVVRQFMFARPFRLNGQPVDHHHELCILDVRSFGLFVCDKTYCVRRFTTDAAKHQFFAVLTTYMTAMTEFRNSLIAEQNNLAAIHPKDRTDYWALNNHFHGLLTSMPKTTECLLAGEGFPQEEDGKDNNRMPSAPRGPIDVPDTPPVTGLSGDTMPNDVNIGGDPNATPVAMGAGRIGLELGEEEEFLNKTMRDFRKSVPRRPIAMQGSTWATEQAVAMGYKTDVQRGMADKRRRIGD